MHYLSEDVPRDKASHLWSALISPRPVFMVVSTSEDGIPNIAAFSSFALISIYPPIISVSFGKRQNGVKNTLTNILATRKFSLNAVPRDLAETANRSAEGVDRVDDFARLGLTKTGFDNSTALRISESPLSIACELQQNIVVQGSSVALILARCTEFFASDEYTYDGLFDPVAADLAASIGLEDFITLKGETFTLPRTWE